ncbi:MAG: ABC transporter permease [Oscillospiraceae bacterium]|nr:ABC transporter permease [Oscillospiraceae bacterium]
MENTKREQYHIRITSKPKLFDLEIGEFFRYKDLVRIFAKKEFDQRYRQTILGPLWAFISPLMSSLMHMFVFGTIAKIGTNGIPQILFYLFSDNLWSLFSSSLGDNAYTLIANTYLFSKVYFPRLVMPMSRTLLIFYRWLIRTVVSMPFYCYFLFQGEIQPRWWAVLVVPVILVLFSMLGCGLGMIISSMTIKYRDLNMLVGFAMGIWMYVTPVVYPLSELRETVMYRFALINPLTGLMELYRLAIFGMGDVLPWNLLYSVVVTVLAFGTGLVVFNRVEKSFVDTV